MTAEDMAEPWREHAACKGRDPDLFYVERGAATAPAKAICDICPVTHECLSFALRVGEKFGIWGGKSERQRRRIRHYVPVHGLPESETA